MTITTLDDIREYFTWLKAQPLPKGPHEFEANLAPLLEAFSDWDEVALAELVVQLGLTLCVKRGEAGKVMLAEAYLAINDVLIQRRLRVAAN